MALFNKNITPPTTTTTNQPSVMSKTAEINSPDRLNRIVEGTSIEGDIRSKIHIGLSSCYATT